MLGIHGMSASGNCYKVRLLLEQLGQPYAWHEVDVLGGATRAPAFLSMNPCGQVPVLEYAPGQYLPESGAILCYLAAGTPFWPDERLAHCHELPLTRATRKALLQKLLIFYQFHLPEFSDVHTPDILEMVMEG